MRNTLFRCLSIFTLFSSIVVAEEISPHKFGEKGLPEYAIPPSSRFSCPRSGEGPNIVYYFSQPSQKESFPIAIFCTGSSSEGSLHSVIHLHRYFLQELLDLGLGVLTLEQWGIDGTQIHEKEFFAHYTRSQRLKDHMDLIQYLEQHPPLGWDGRFVFIGVSEGGPLVTELTTLCPNTIATINWSGAGDWAWADELWQFFQHWKQKSWLVWMYDLIPRCLPFSSDVPHSRSEYDTLVQNIIANPTSDKWMGGMTYLYHADAFLTPRLDYTKLKSPFLVVSGTEDSNIASSDQFVEQAKEAGAPITYFRIEGMDHYIRHRPDVIEESFTWLQRHLD